MLEKPELFENVCNYGQRTIYEYESFLEGLERMKIEDLKILLECVYKDGVKDGIEFYKELNTE